MRQPRVLMCPPDYYGIEYEINPWMHVEQGATRDRAQAQWQRLYDTLRRLSVQVAQGFKAGSFSLDRNIWGHGPVEGPPRPDDQLEIGSLTSLKQRFKVAAAVLANAENVWLLFRSGLSPSCVKERRIHAMPDERGFDLPAKSAVEKAHLRCAEYDYSIHPPKDIAVDPAANPGVQVHRRVDHDHWLAKPKQPFGDDEEQA